MECNNFEAENETPSFTKESLTEVDSSGNINLAEEERKCVDNCQLSDAAKHLCPLKKKETTGTKVKRKTRSTRRKLNAMVNNTSLHFSDTDSEGELTTMTPQTRASNHAPIISVTLDNAEATNGLPENSILSPDGKDTIQCSNFVDNLTDVDEIYPSETENDQEENKGDEVAEDARQDETDLEDFEAGDEVQTAIYVRPRSDIFSEYSGETIVTKESDGPFSVEIRNKMYRDEIPQESCGNAPNIVVVSNTDEEDMVVSDEEDMQEICCSRKEFLEDLDVLAASQIVMRNINKMENALIVKDTSDDAISDCHTDTEEVDPIE